MNPRWLSRASRLALRMALAATIVIATAGVALAGQRGLEEVKTAGTKNIHVLHVRGNVYMLAGAGCNITVEVGKEYVIVVDSGLPQFADEVVTTIRNLTTLPIMFLGNTTSDADHTGGNTILFRAGWALPNATRGFAREEEKDRSRLKLLTGTTIVTSLSVSGRTEDQTGKNSAITFGKEGFKLYNNEPVIWYNMGRAHTEGDSVVLFRGSDVLSAGELFSTTSFPVIDRENGGTIDGYLDALNDLIVLLVPEYGEEGGTYVIPGHGHLSDRADVVNYRDMVTIVRSRIEKMVRNGMTFEQVKAAKPTLDYDGVYGAESGLKFTEAVYHDIMKGAPQPATK